MDNTELPKILLLGCEGVGKSSIAGRLLDQRPLQVEADERVWLIDTKYYTAEVGLCETRLKDARPTAALENPLEAVIVVFDAERESTFLEAKRWLESERGERPWQIGLLVANKVDLFGDRRPGWLDHAAELAASEMVEYIEASATDEMVDTGLERDGDRQGVARVVDALQAHMWPGLKMKEDRRNGGASTKALPEIQEGGGGSCDSKVSENGNERLGNGVGASSGKGMDDENVGQVTDDGDVEDMVDGFDKILTEMLGARERLQNMPDAQRREAAAQIALRLASFMEDGHEEEIDELH